MAKQAYLSSIIKYIAAMLLLGMAVVFAYAIFRQDKAVAQSTHTQYVYTDNPPTFMTNSSKLTHQQISQAFNLPYPLPPFNPDRTLEEMEASCKVWPISPAPDEDSKNWYRAATTLNAIKLRTEKQHQQMLQLYEAAARKGHYLAAKNLTMLYGEGQIVVGGRFMPEPAKARYWVERAITKHQWIGALEWVPYTLSKQGSGYSETKDYYLAYIQQAADLGVGLAQFALSSRFKIPGKPSPHKDILVRCAAEQGVSAAAHDYGLSMEVRKQLDEAFRFYQIAVMNGGRTGSKAAYALATFPWPDDASRKLYGSVRRAAYRELDDAIGEDSFFYRFPRLNEVLPPPPAEVTEWKGIYSAMSEDDAAYYQNPPPAEFYLKQVQEAGLLIPLEHISQPYYPKPGESLI